MVKNPLRKNKGGRKKGKGMMQVAGLAKEWDKVEPLRERLRTGGSLIHPDSSAGEDVKTLRLNADLMGPMLERMADSPVKGHPPIDGLREEVEQLFVMNKRHPVPEFATLQKVAWRLRFMVCYVKMKVRRNEPSRDARLSYKGLLLLLFLSFTSRVSGSRPAEAVPDLEAIPEGHTYMSCVYLR